MTRETENQDEFIQPLKVEFVISKWGDEHFGKARTRTHQLRNTGSSRPVALSGACWWLVVSTEGYEEFKPRMVKFFEKGIGSIEELMELQPFYDAVELRIKDIPRFTEQLETYEKDEFGGTPNELKPTALVSISVACEFLGKTINTVKSWIEAEQPYTERPTSQRLLVSAFWVWSRKYSQKNNKKVENSDLSVHSSVKIDSRLPAA